MANADHTARARPKVYSRAHSRTPLTPQTSPSDLSEAHLATVAIVHVLATAVSAQSASRHPDALAQLWRLDRPTLNGLTAALKMVSERAEALRRTHTEGRSV